MSEHQAILLNRPDGKWSFREKYKLNPPKKAKKNQEVLATTEATSSVLFDDEYIKSKVKSKTKEVPVKFIRKKGEGSAVAVLSKPNLPKEKRTYTLSKKSKRGDVGQKIEVTMPSSSDMSWRRYQTKDVRKKVRRAFEAEWGKSLRDATDDEKKVYRQTLREMLNGDAVRKNLPSVMRVLKPRPPIKNAEKDTEGNAKITGVTDPRIVTKAVMKAASAYSKEKNKKWKPTEVIKNLYVSAGKDDEGKYLPLTTEKLDNMKISFGTGQDGKYTPETEVSFSQLKLNPPIDMKGIAFSSGSGLMTGLVAGSSGVFPGSKDERKEVTSILKKGNVSLESIRDARKYMSKESAWDGVKASFLLSLGVGTLAYVTKESPGLPEYPESLNTKIKHSGIYAASSLVSSLVGTYIAKIFRDKSIEKDYQYDVKACRESSDKRECVFTGKSAESLKSVKFGKNGGNPLSAYLENLSSKSEKKTEISNFQKAKIAIKQIEKSSKSNAEKKSEFLKVKEAFGLTPKEWEAILSAKRGGRLNVLGDYVTKDMSDYVTRDDMGESLLGDYVTMEDPSAGQVDQSMADYLSVGSSDGDMSDSLLSDEFDMSDDEADMSDSLLSDDEDMSDEDSDMSDSLLSDDEDMGDSIFQWNTSPLYQRQY